MNKTETIEILAMAKGCWQNMAVDDLVRNSWGQVLEPVSYQAAKMALLQLARTGLDRITPGQLFEAATDVEEMLAERDRQSRPALIDPNRRFDPGTIWSSGSGEMIADETGKLRRMTDEERLDPRGACIKLRRTGT